MFSVVRVRNAGRLVCACIVVKQLHEINGVANHFGDYIFKEFSDAMCHPVDTVVDCSPASIS
jgi:hypothetical protein